MRDFSDQVTNTHSTTARQVKSLLSGNNEHWFAGKPQDAASGLSYFGARYYDPVLGRFMGIDPVAPDPAKVHGLNRYAYANNNPYRYVDPDGRYTVQLSDVPGDEVELVGPPQQSQPTSVLSKIDSLLGVMEAIPMFGPMEASALKLGIALSTISRSSALDTKIAGPLLDALSKAKPTQGHPNQVMHQLDDGTKVLFRKDFDDQAHNLGNIFQGKGRINHYNVQIQDAKGKTIENLHIVPDGNGSFTRWGKDNVVKTE